jgi:hypothetical protein
MYSDRNQVTLLQSIVKEVYVYEKAEAADHSDIRVIQDYYSVLIF